jgi:hypothetical protein
MNNESAPEIFNHKDNRHYQTRLDYMLLYRSEGKAKIIRTLESWTNTKYAEWYKAKADSREQKKEPPDENLWVTMSYDEFSLFIYGTIQFETIKKQVDELVVQGHLQRRPHPEYPYGPPQYLLNRAVIQQALDELEIPPDLFDLAPIFIRPRKKHTPPETYPQGGGKNTPRVGGNVPPPKGETSPPSKNSTKNLLESTKNEGTYPREQSDDSPSPIVSPPHALSQSEIAELIRSRIPEGDAILLERLGKNSHRIYRKSGRPIGELIPVGVDVSEGLLELITVDSAPYIPALSEKQGETNATHPTHAGPAHHPGGDSNRNLAQTTSDEHAHGKQPSQPSQVDSPDEDRTAAQLSTLQASYPQARAKLAPATEQDVFIARPAVPEMPLQSARWCSETALLVSEALRGKYYTDSQRKNQQNSATRMFRDFKCITRPQFEEIFADWAAWWREHDKGFFTLADLLVRGQNREVRLQTALDRLEARTAPVQSKKLSNNIVTVPRDSGMVEWWDKSGVRRLMTYAEADDNGWEGGFGEFIQHTDYGKAVIRS